METIINLNSTQSQKKLPSLCEGGNVHTVGTIRK